MEIYTLIKYKFLKISNQEMIKTHFSQFGEIIDCVVPRDPRTRFAKGFAFVTYTKGKAVDDVMANRPHQVRIHLTMTHGP